MLVIPENFMWICPLLKQLQMFKMLGKRSAKPFPMYSVYRNWLISPMYNFEIKSYINFHL